MAEPTRREALVTIAAAVPATAVAADYRPKTLSGPRYRVLAVAVDLIIPESSTPGAAGAGVPEMIDEDAGAEAWRGALEAALDHLLSGGFLDSNATGRTAILNDYQASADERRMHFKLLKDLTVDYYYATEIGLADELGYKGNTYLAEFPGCTHDHSAGATGEKN